jgi:hypothetical protein
MTRAEIRGGKILMRNLLKDFPVALLVRKERIEGRHNV